MIYVTRASDVGRSKANTAAARINQDIAANGEVCGNKIAPEPWRVVPLFGKVCDISAGGSSILTDAFWANIDVVVSAVDNLETRLYLDEQCCRYGIAMVDAGTHGVLGSTQVILPGLTEKYSDAVDPETGSIPVCTIKSFPYKVHHCVAWAKQQLDNICVFEVGLLNQLRTMVDEAAQKKVLASRTDAENESFKDWVDALNTLDALKQRSSSNYCDDSSDKPVSVLHSVTLSDFGMREKSLETAVFLEYSFKLFFRLFEKETSDLLAQHPVGSEDDEGSGQFWSGARHKIPNIESWPAFVNGYKLSCLREFIVHTCILKAGVSGISLSYAEVSDALDLFENMNIIDGIRQMVISPRADLSNTTVARSNFNISAVSESLKFLSVEKYDSFIPLEFDKVNIIHSSLRLTVLLHCLMLR